MVNLSLASPSCTYRAASWGGGGGGVVVPGIVDCTYTKTLDNLMPCSSEQDHQVCRHPKNGGGGRGEEGTFTSCSVLFLSSL